MPEQNTKRAPISISQTANQHRDKTATRFDIKLTHAGRTSFLRKEDTPNF